jgi:hypothetical protein
MSRLISPTSITFIPYRFIEGGPSLPTGRQVLSVAKVTNAKDTGKNHGLTPQLHIIAGLIHT